MASDEEKAAELNTLIQHRLIEKLSETEGRYRRLVDSIDEVVFTVASDGVFTYVNPAWSVHTGFSEEATLSQPIGSFLESGSFSLGSDVGVDKQATVDKGGAQLYAFRNHDGGTVWMDVSVHQGDADHWNGTMHNVSEAVQTKAELQGYADSLEETNKKLEALTAALNKERNLLERKVEERTRSLQEANQALAHASEVQRELHSQKISFFQNIAHEIRTPVTLIINPLQKIAGRIPEDPDLQMALRNSARLQSLVDQTLDFERLSSGSQTLGVLYPIHLGEVLTRCVEDVRAMRTDSSVEFVCTQDGMVLEPVLLKSLPVYIRADVGALEKIIFNLLTNALKYIGSGDRIEVGLATSGDQVILYVRDNGVGITAQDQEHIFESFYRVQEGAQLAKQGTGLGLALVKMLVEGLNGRIEVESAPGEGSTFSCFFERSEPLENEVVERAVVTTTQNRGPIVVEGQRDELEFREVPLATGTVLVVDDVRDMRELICDRLMAWGYSVWLASNGKMGLEAVRNHQPDLVISDWMMPEMSGDKMVELIKNHPETASIPTILLTARTDVESRLLGQGAGAEAYLGKPFSDDELKTVVRNLWRLKQKERALDELNQRIEKDVLRRYLAPTVVDEIMSGRIKFDSEPKRLSITVMFVDLVGFTELTQRLRAARAANILNSFLEEMIRAVFDYQGTVDKVLGDGLMVLFGAPCAMDPVDQVDRATGCAQAMHAALESVNAKWAEDLDRRLQIRVGIHHGPAMVGNFGSKQRVDFSAIGPTVNLASRLESVCAEGATYLSGEVVDFLDDSQFEFVGEFQFKGIEGMRHVFRICELPGTN